jgi:RHS repeat-associated protein
MVSALRAFLAQLLSLALVMANFAPAARVEMPLERWRTSGSIRYKIERPIASSIRNPVRSEYSLSTKTDVRTSLRPSRRGTQTQVATLPGQSSTPLPNGRILLLGGEGKEGPVGTAAILDLASSTSTQLSSGLLQARAWHSATVLPNGKVFIFGGAGNGGNVLATGEVYDPATQAFSSLSPLGLTARAHHTATLLTDGTVLLAGGLDLYDQTLGTVQVWDTRSTSADNVDALLIASRSDHTATLQADGTVLLWGGKNQSGSALDYGEVYDPTTQGLRIQNFKPAPSQGPLTVAATLPEDGTETVPLDVVITVRFSAPVLMQSANNTTAILNAGTQQTNATVVPAEAGMLLFITPQESLMENAEYTVSLNGISASGGSTLADFTFGFRTASQSGVQSNSSNGLLGLLTSPGGVGPSENSSYLKLPRLQAPAGETAISGQVLLQSGLPLQGVTLRVGSNSAQSDATGRFLVVGVPPGHDVLVIDGRTANTNTVTYGVFEVGVDVKNLQTNDLDYTNWMPVIDTSHAVTISVPTAQETVVTTPLIPGLEFHLPAGTTVTDIDGNPANQISITPIPASQPPFPLPKRVSVPLYFTIQPGGGVISVSNPDTPQGGWLVHPNSAQRKPGTRYHYWNYDPENKGWFVKGGGSVTAAGSTVVPDSGVVMDTLTGTSVTCAPIPPVGPHDCKTKDGDPVDLGTGLFVYKKTDLYEPDVIPIVLTRVYRQGDPIARDFGIGTRHPYDIFVGSSDSANCSYMDLYLPDFTRIHYTRYSNGTACGAYGTPIPIFVCNTCPGAWFGSTLYWTGGYGPVAHWAIYRRDGLTFDFPAGATNASIQTLGLTGIHDPNNNYLSITRDQNSYITNITSPNGRFINFLYDSNYNLTKATDGFGRTVQYSYDPSSRLTQVIDANGGVWQYSYDSNGDMITITDPRQITYLTNHYDANFRVDQQTQADLGTFKFNYITDPLNNVTETDVTDPRGNVRKVTFNSPPIYYDGYSTGGTLASDTRAAGTSITQTTSYQYDPGTYLRTSSTDALGRTTSFTYDPAGNLASITRLVGTPNQLTTGYGYQVEFAKDVDTGTPSQTLTRLSSVTDPLGHNTQFEYDSYGNLLSTTDPLGNTTTYSNDLEGRVVSVTDPVGETTKFVYDGPDLGQLTDPLGRTVTFSNGLSGPSGGRLLTFSDPLTHATGLQYNPFDQITSITDPLNGVTQLSYDANRNLASVTDGNQHPTTYSYDSMDRRATRRDALSHQESYQYDGDGNLISYTDERGKVATFSYDGLNRLTFAGFGTQAGPTYESTINLNYDNGNRLTNIVDSTSGTISRTYDGLDHLTGETTPQGTLTYVYDAAGRRISMTVNGQPQVSYTYDNANTLTSVSQGASTVTIGHDADGRRTSLLLPNGIVMSYSYDAASELTGISYQVGAASVGSLSYSYDASGRRTGLTGSYAQASIPAPVASAAYNTVNQLTQWGSTAFSYDASGNLINDGVNTYSWDARGRLVSISGVASAAFQYDASNRRTTKTVNGSTTTYLYDLVNPIQELAGGVATANLLTGLQLDEFFTRTDSSGSQSFLTDALGSTLGLVNGSGNITTQYEYEPFGNVTQSGSPSGNSYQFTGRENDRTGLFYNRARYYSPMVQRFISQDPIGFRGGSTNLFSYVGNSPSNLRDPYGLQFCEDPLSAALCTMAVAGAASGVVNSVEEGYKAAKCGKSPKEILKDMGKGLGCGFVGGAVGASVALGMGGVAGGAVGSLVQSGCGIAASGKSAGDVSPSQVLGNAAGSAVTGGITDKLLPSDKFGDDPGNLLGPLLDFARGRAMESITCSD